MPVWPFLFVVNCMASCRNLSGEMQENKYADLIKRIELEELVQTNVAAESYSQLLAAYLYQDKLSDARYLWKRIPQSIKNDNKELERLYVVMSALIKNNTAEFFNKIDFPWSGVVKPIIDDLLGRMRQDVLMLVGHAYISIFEKQLMLLTQLPREQLKQACNALNWVYENEDRQVIIFPKRPDTVPRLCTTSEDLLFKLTDFVSFLEN